MNAKSSSAYRQMVRLLVYQDLLIFIWLLWVQFSRISADLLHRTYPEMKMWGEHVEPELWGSIVFGIQELGQNSHAPKLVFAEQNCLNTELFWATKNTLMWYEALQTGLRIVASTFLGCSVSMFLVSIVQKVKRPIAYSCLIVHHCW